MRPLRWEICSSGDKTRTAQLLVDLAETLRRDAREHLWGITSETIQNGSIPAAMERQIRERISDEIPAYFAEKLASFASEINRALQQVILPYQERIDGLISALRST